jgi:predicted dehydrogenase
MEASTKNGRPLSAGQTDRSVIRVVIVGCGAISELYYAPALRDLQPSGVEVMAVMDPESGRAAKVQSLCPRAVLLRSLDEVLRIPIQLAIVASPPRFHAQQTIALLEAGIAVLCEKPMAATVAECEAMIAAAAKSHALLAVGLFRRFFPVAQMIRDLIRQQSLGPVKRFEISEGGPFNWPAQSASFFQKTNSQGGVLADLGVHVLDLLLWWFGPPEQVRYEDDAMGWLEANCRLELAFAGGVSGTVRLSRDTQLPNRTIIECERGWVRCPAASANQLEMGIAGADLALNGQLVTVESADPQGIRGGEASSYHQSFTRQLGNVVAALRGEEELLVPGEQGLLSLQLIERCYRERKLMPMPWLTKPELQTAQKIVGTTT